MSSPANRDALLPQELELDLAQLANSLEHMPLHLLLGVPEAYVVDLQGTPASSGAAAAGADGAQPVMQPALQQPVTVGQSPAPPAVAPSIAQSTVQPQLPAFMAGKLGGGLQQGSLPLAVAQSVTGQQQQQQAMQAVQPVDDDLSELEDLLLHGTASSQAKPAPQPPPSRPSLAQQQLLPSRPHVANLGAAAAFGAVAADDELDALLNVNSSSRQPPAVPQLSRGPQVRNM